MAALREVVRTAQVSPLTVGIEEAARALSVSASTVRRLIRRNHLLTVRIGGRVMVPTVELRRLSTPAAVPSKAESPPKDRAKKMAERVRRGH